MNTGVAHSDVILTIDVLAGFYAFNAGKDMYDAITAVVVIAAVTYGTVTIFHSHLFSLRSFHHPDLGIPVLASTPLSFAIGSGLPCCHARCH